MDENGVLFAEEKISNNLLKKLKKSKYSNDKRLLKPISSAEDLEEINRKNKLTIPIRLDFVEKRDIDRSTLCSTGRPFQLIQADIADLRFLGKSTTYPKYCLLAVDVFSSKIYTYPMQQHDLLIKKLKRKRKNNKMHLQADMEFQKNNKKELNKKFNVEIFSTETRGGKAFAAEQKISELKKRIPKLNLIKSKGITPLNLIKELTENMNKTESGKYGLSPEHIKK